MDQKEKDEYHFYFNWKQFNIEISLLSEIILN